MKVLFICKGNYYRSQIAEAIYNKFTASHNATSVGTCVGEWNSPTGKPLSELYPRDSAFFKVLESHGMDVRNNTTKKLTPEMLDQYDVVVSMAEKSFCDDFLKNDKRVIWWDVKDEGGGTLESMRQKYDEIEKLVRGLIGHFNK